MAQSLQDLNDDPNPAHSHYLLSRFLAIVGDEAHKPIWPVLYPSSNFEDTLLGQIQSIRAVRTTSAEGSSGEGLCRDAQNTSQATARE